MCSSQTTLGRIVSTVESRLVSKDCDSWTAWFAIVSFVRVSPSSVTVWDEEVEVDVDVNVDVNVDAPAVLL
jgi:hypothetical protein